MKYAIFRETHYHDLDTYGLFVVERETPKRWHFKWVEGDRCDRSFHYHNTPWLEKAACHPIAWVADPEVFVDVVSSHTFMEQSIEAIQMRAEKLITEQRNLHVARVLNHVIGAPK